MIDNIFTLDILSVLGVSCDFRLYSYFRLASAPDPIVALTISWKMSRCVGVVICIWWWRNMLWKVERSRDEWLQGNRLLNNRRIWCCRRVSLQNLSTRLRCIYWSTWMVDMRGRLAMWHRGHATMTGRSNPHIWDRVTWIPRLKVPQRNERGCGIYISC
jgi:hypothetical protein